MFVRKEARCPGCGASATIPSPAILQIACAYCDSIFTWDHEQTKECGKKANLIPPHSGITLSSEIKVKYKSYIVLGRVQYGYSYSEESTTGIWDEWYLQSDDGDLWITEDSGEFSIEETISNPPKVGKLNTGDIFDYKGTSYLISETGTVVCRGTSGMLPFQIIPKETYFYADAIKRESKDQEILSLEYDEDIPSFFIGRKLSPSDIHYEAQDSRLQTPIQTAVTLKCISCAAPLQPNGKDLVTIVCDSCGTVQQLDASTSIALGKSPSSLGEYFKLKIGSTLKLYQTDYIVTGRLYYEWEEEEDGEVEIGSVYDYLLYNSEKGYLYLTEEEDTFTAFLPAPAPSINLQKSFSESGTFLYEGDTYKYIETGSLTLLYVDGALPWVAKIQSRVQYTDAKCKKTYLSEEITLDDSGTPREIAYYKGRRISHSQILKSQPDLDLGDKPIPKLAGQAFLKIFSILMSVLFVFLYFFMDSSELILQEKYSQSDLLLKEIYTNSFEIKNPDESIEIRIQTNVDNAFTHLGIALYNPSQTEVITGEDLGIEYYSGVDDGESWSEGSNSESIYWKLKSPGTYQLIVTAFDGDTPPEFTSIQLEVYKNAIRLWPFLVLSILWIMLAILFFIRSGLSTPSKNNLSEDI